MQLWWEREIVYRFGWCKISSWRSKKYLNWLCPGSLWDESCCVLKKSREPIAFVCCLSNTQLGHHPDHCGGAQTTGRKVDIVRRMQLGLSDKCSMLLLNVISMVLCTVT